MARLGMANIIAELRQMTDTATQDVLLEGTYFWTDDQLQEVLDRYSVPLTDVPLIPKPLWYSGTYKYLEYHLPSYVGQWVEEPTVSNNLFQVLDTSGNETATTNYTFEPEYGRVTFNSDQNGTAWLIRARSYQIHKAAADIWHKKAALRASLIEVRGGGFLFKEDQEYQHCMQQAAYFSGRSGFNSVKLIRTGYR